MLKNFYKLFIIVQFILICAVTNGFAGIDISASGIAAVNADASIAAANVAAANVAPATTIISISYGKSGIINYNLQSGTFKVSQNGKEIFHQVYATSKINGDSLSSGNYKTRNYSKKSIKDGFGNGIRHTITLTSAGLPQMQQIFYTYTGKDYFFTELMVTGTNLKSNYMAPFKGKFDQVIKNANTLFVPFDNDTFISYDSRPFSDSRANNSAEVGVVYNDQSRAGIIAGSVEHEIWKTGVRTVANDKSNDIQVWGGYTEESVTRDKIAHGQISGNTLKSPKLFIGYFEDWRTGMELYSKANRTAEPPYVFNWTKPTPVGWNSWGVIQEKITYDKAVKVVDFFADSLSTFRIGKTAYIDLDSYWDALVKGNDFSTLKKFADYCKSKGLEPGVYWAPFTDWGFKDGGDRKVEGGNYKFSDIWTKTGDSYHELDGARAIDPTHPGTRQRMAYFINKFKDCGFKMIKIDFLGHAAIEANKFYDPSVTTGMQAYRKGMEYLIDLMDSQMLVYAAISPTLATGRYVHSRRIACDAFKTIEHTRYTLNSVNYGWWQTYLYNYVDADHVVFADQPIGANRARLLSSVITGTVISGDDFSVHGAWSSNTKKLYQNPELLDVIKNGKAFVPVDAKPGTGASELFCRKIGNNFYLAVFNYESTAKIFSIDGKRLGIDLKNIKGSKELLQDNKVVLNDHINIELNGADAALYKFTMN